MISRKLDIAITDALGCKVKFYYCGECEVQHNEPNNKYRNYSTSGNAMLELDREMRERGYDLELQIIGEYYGADYYHLEDGIGGDIQQAKTEPLARALAAYKALTGKEWQEGEGN